MWSETGYRDVQKRLARGGSSARERTGSGLRTLVRGVILLVVMTVSPFPLRAAVYSSALSDSWKFRSHDGRCVLSVSIPGYGEGRFIGVPGLGQRLELDATLDPFQPGEVIATARAPEWRADFPREAAHGALRHVRNGLISATGDVAGELLRAMADGNEIHVTGIRTDNPAVVLRPVRFAAVFNEFARCQQWRMPADFNDVERSRILFASGGSALTAADERQLRQLAEYVRADRTMTAIYIDGHADSSGSERGNLRLSRSRANRVADFLVRNGIPKSMLTIRFHGARYPAPEARDLADSRRVTIRLEHRQGDEWPEQFLSAGEPATR
ncbi:MAG: OmpA family protein [Pseudomonadales bacterium]|nr:OmpA family protein [Pseudomonadales bacterium]MCP5182399.1 OmpA family protein [Pseudomonadales bacterium]